MTGLSNQEFVSEGLSYTVSSVSANVAEDFSVTLEPGAAKAEEVVALASFTIPLTGSTIVAASAVMTTYSASSNCADFATPTCSEDVCVMMSCGGGSLTLDGAYNSLLGQREADNGIKEVLPRGVPPPAIGGIDPGSFTQLGNGSHHQRVVPAF